MIEFLSIESHELEHYVYCYLYYEELDSTLGMLQSLWSTSHLVKKKKPLMGFEKKIMHE